MSYSEDLMYLAGLMEQVEEINSNLTDEYEELDEEICDVLMTSRELIKKLEEQLLRIV